MATARRAPTWRVRQLSRILDLELLQIPESDSSHRVGGDTARASCRVAFCTVATGNHTIAGEPATTVQTAHREFQSPEFEFAFRTLLPGRFVCHIANGCAVEHNTGGSMRPSSSCCVPSIKPLASINERLIGEPQASRGPGTFRTLQGGPDHSAPPLLTARTGSKRRPLIRFDSRRRFNELQTLMLV